MPEENIISTDVKSALDGLEHYGLLNHLSRTQNYKAIQNALEKGENLSLEDTKRLLEICVHDLKEDMRFTATIMHIIPAIISRVQEGKYDPCPDLLPSALAVIHIIKTTALLSKVELVTMLCYNTLLAYPDDTLIAATEHHEEIMEIFNLYCHLRIPPHIRLQACSFLHKLLKILPPEKKKQFVGKEISVWFSKIIPTAMSHLNSYSSNYDYGMIIEILEHLTNELVAFDYTDNQQWYYVLECICGAQKYPSVMKNLLQRGSGIWHRVWIVFIRLLKHQVTQSLGTIGTPINSMLPVVEAAFKVDVDNRCKAFECWNVLIDSFSTETNESNINKRIKLLIIPLKSNNAKAEATALAKFRCWWHLIQKFQNKIDKFIDIILVSFLHFCFGRHNAADKSVLIPGQISTAVKKQCILAIVDMVGHVNCNGCTDLPKLKGKVINTKNLVDNWNHWIFSLTSTIIISTNIDNGLTKQQMSCLWKSYLLTIGELPENNIRNDLFAEMISILEHLVKNCKSNSKLADIVLNVLVLSLFDGDMRIKQLLKTRSEVYIPLCKIILVILNPSLNAVYQSCNPKEMVTKLTAVTSMILDPDYCAPTFSIGFVLNKLTATDISLMVWTALAESICQAQYEMFCLETLCDVMMWPLQSINSFTEIKMAAMTWYTMYDLFHSKLKKSETFDKDISKFLFTVTEVTPSTIYFKLCVALGVIKHKLVKGTCASCVKELEILHIVVSRIDNYQSYEQIFPILIDRVLTALTSVVSDINETAARYLLFCVKKMLKVMTQACKQLTDVYMLSLIESLLKSLDSLFKIESYHKLVPVIVDDLIDCSSFLSKQPSTKSTVLCIMKTLTSKVVESDITLKKIKALIDDIENETVDIDKNQSSDKNKFTTPKIKEVPKKTKKKEASIVNTVVENGEEYVVVKSNWKFNPRKLTENQKEKLQRKREDIPALYQDLSQSQDEFKLVSWKTDSQDTSNSSKSESKSCKSGTNETATEILSNLPSSFVPNSILESFFADKNKKDSLTNEKDTLPVDNVNKIDAVTPKNTKSPRMALKDRVFRNVRSLLEKSGVQKENKHQSEDLNKAESVVKTPVKPESEDTANIVNSAPAMLSADRPSRVKRKPKKFDESLLLGGKKSRQSLQDSKSKDLSKQSNSDITSLNTDKEKDVNVIKEVSPTIVSVLDVEEVNKPNDLHVLENQNISCANEIVQSNLHIENLHTDVSEIDNTTNEVSEAPTTEIEPKEKPTTRIDLDTTMDIDVNNEMSNENIDENIDNKNEVSNKKEVETCNDIKDKNSNKESEKCRDIRDQSSNENKDRSSNEVINEKSNDKKEQSKDSKNDEYSSERQTSPSTEDVKKLSPSQKVSKNKGTEEQKSSTKKTSVRKSRIEKELAIDMVETSVRKSRIEKELAIDMVEGHPFLKMQSQKRLTRKALESVGTGRRKSLVEKLNKSKSESKSDKKTKEKNKESDSSSSSFTVDDSQEKDTEVKDQTSFTEDLPYSDDVIESSQDSTITTISVKSTKKANKKVPVVSLEKMKLLPNKADDINASQSILDCVIVSVSESTKANQESKDDIELPVNKTVLEEKSEADLTENMDTEPIHEKDFSEVVIIINDDVPAPLTISSDETEAGPETQEIAEADTQPTDTNDFMEVDVIGKNTNTSLTVVDITTNEFCHNEDKEESLAKEKSASQIPVNPLDNTTLTLSESTCVELEKETGASSPSSYREEAKRKQDFLNNTLEISPIKNMSPDRNKKSPSPETSCDYVVITLSSPVHSNGEPFEKCGSPEVFTEDKVSPDKRDQSPPRVEVTVTNTSPSSSLSLKKNRPQVRSGGRAAQMLGLCCVPDKVQAIINQEKIETEEIKKTSTSSTPARRNLRILYNSVSENIEPPSENEDSENFLKFRRSLPAVDSSPSGPILKRKLVEIADDATISPASKRKRVSFHDPPVSTTVSVQKYIEPGGVRSPQNSAQKRLERQMRQHTPLKSPKRLDHAFKLDTVLNRAIESFTETGVISTPDDTQPFSLDETPVVEIVRASELNDSDPICPDLIDCNDPIDNIASELSSSAMKSLLVKELVGKVETVGDLAKMTELEVNRLCIKAPKVKVAKKVLSDYASKRVKKPSYDVMVTLDEVIFDEPMSDTALKGVERVDMEVQTVTNAAVEMEIQTVATPITDTFVQTETTPTANTVVQTDETGSRSTADIVKLCLAERPDFVEQVGEHLEECSIQQITDKLPFSAITDVLMKKVTPCDAKTLLNRVLEDQWNNTPHDNRSSKELSFMRQYMCDRFDPKDLILFCSEVLKCVYDKPAFP